MYLKKLNLLFLLLIPFFQSFSQQVAVHAKVVGNKNAPLAGATIVNTVNNKTVISDENGMFSFDGLTPNTSLNIRVSYVGYSTVEKAIALGTSSINDVVIILQTDALSLSDVIVTGVVNPRSKLNSSVSVSTVRPEDFAKAAPRTTAEIFRSIPGIKAEASGGDGNTNITVRGIPISAGGSKYLQLQEDGLPVLQFGDIAFATQDIFLRADNSLAKIEAIRGGSASTMASNSPSGIINFISKTGVVEGGSVSQTIGLDYDNYRTDFNFGSPIGNGLSFHAAGFYRVGEGPRTAGFKANNGGQLKLNMTKQFSKGYVRVYTKFLNDRAAAYMPMPLQVSGTNSNPNYENVAGYDAIYGAMQSPYLLQNYGLGVDGALRKSSVVDGMHPVSKTFGAEFNFDLGDGWKFEDRVRYAINNGRFVAPFPASVGSRASMLSTIAGAKGWNLTNATLKYAGTNAAFTGTNAMIIHMFDTELNDFNNLTNDLKFKKKFDKVSLNIGYYKASQNIDMSWLWNSYLTDINGDGSKPLDIYNSTGKKMTQNGLYAYGVPVWGNCCQRSYDVNYSISAPSVALSLEASDAFTIDASLRWDFGKVNGTYAGAAQSIRDMNNNGVIDSTELSVSSIDHANYNMVNYKYDYTSYSIGANYKLSEKQAVFARYSSGGTAKADRLLFTPNVFADGSAKGTYDKIDQAELGYKQNFNKGGVFATFFYAKVNEAGGYEATTQRVIENHYKSLGLELEANVNVTDELNVKGSATYTKAEITDGSNKGNKPRRQAPFIYNLVPTFSKNKFSAGISVIGTSSSYSQDDNKLKFKGYALVNPFVSYKLSSRLSASLNGNNMLNTLGITEAEEGSITENTTNIIRARSVTGRTISATVSLNF